MRTIGELRQAIRNILNEAWDEDEEQMLSPEQEPTTDPYEEEEFVYGNPRAKEDEFTDAEDNAYFQDEPEELNIIHGEDLPVEDDDEETSRKSGYAKGEADVNYKDIADKLGFASAQAVDVAIKSAMEKVGALRGLKKQEYAQVMMSALDEYIDALGATGELSDEEVSFMRAHPNVALDVALEDKPQLGSEFDGNYFRSVILPKYIKRVRRDYKEKGSPKPSDE